MATESIQITYDEGHFYVSLPYANNYLLEDLPEKRWVNKVKKWQVPANWRSAPVLLDRLDHATWTREARQAARSQERPSLAPQADERMLENFPFVHPPFDHQRDAYLKAFYQDYFALFFEQGLGKTKTAIDLCAMWHSMGIIDTVLVISPVSIRQVWLNEFKTHHPEPDGVDIRIMDTKGGMEWDWSNPGLKVLVCGVESLSQGKTYDLIQGYLKKLRNIALIVDESSRVKNPKATRTQRVIDLSASCRKRLILTGTPVTQGLQDLYSQFLVLNPETLALTSFYAFRNRYCVTQEIPGAPKGAVKIVAYQRVDELMELIDPWSLRKTKIECLDLPEKTYQTRSVTMTPVQKKHYQELRDDLWTQIVNEKGEKDIIEVEMILEAYMRLQQITGGHYPIITESLLEDGRISRTSEAKPLPGKNPKLAELMELMDELQGKKVIVFARFRPEVEIISTSLRSLGLKVKEFHGGLTEAEKNDSVTMFQGGDADVLVCSEAAAYGLTLTAASTVIYYSQSFSLEVFLQSQDRVHRIGQTEPCTYILLECVGSVDVDVSKALMNKKSLADVVSERLEDSPLDRPF